MKNNDIEQLREDLDQANERINDLVNVLVDSQIVRVDHHMQYTFYYSNVRVLRDKKEVLDKTQMILNHLGLEFEWIDCKPHYELKEKKEEK